MLEVEVKYAVPDFVQIEALLHEWKLTLKPPLHEVDQYFNAPDRDFAKTDEAVRIRTIGQLNFITYKGPKRDQLTKTRTELELPLGPGSAASADWAKLLVHLGYRPSGMVKKSRRIAHVQRQGFALEVCLDEVEQLGTFVELEIVAPDEQYETAKAVLLSAAEEMALTTQERRSYLSMILAQ